MPVQRDVAVMFSSMAVLFAVDLLRAFGGAAPAWLAEVGYRAHPGPAAAALRLVRRLRPVRLWPFVTAAVGWLVATAVVAIVGEPYPPTGLAIVLGYFVPHGRDGRLAAVAAGPAARRLLARAAAAGGGGHLAVRGGDRRGRHGPRR